MEDLEAFMLEEKEELVEYIASPKFKAKEGKIIPWKIKSIPADENQKIRKDCYFNVPVTGKKGRFTKDFNAQKYLVILATECVVYPDLQNAKLQDFYKVQGVEQLLGKLLKPGEYDDLMEKIQEINGYSLEDKVEEAKN